MHVMLDLETLGSAPGSVILSIGAVAFTQTDIVHTFETAIDARSCQRAGLRIDADTVMWWLKQGEDARQALLTADAVPLHAALTLFSEWLAFDRCVTLWSKGPSFDAVLLASAYRVTGLPQPWEYRNERCVRTILELAGIEVKEYRRDGETRHHALTDALVQARAVQAAMKLIQTAKSTI